MATAKATTSTIIPGLRYHLQNETEADFALAELIEYVRVSVQIVFEELGAQLIPDSGLTTIH